MSTIRGAISPLWRVFSLFPLDGEGPNFSCYIRHELGNIPQSFIWTPSALLLYSSLLPWSTLPSSLYTRVITHQLNPPTDLTLLGYFTDPPDRTVLHRSRIDGMCKLLLISGLIIVLFLFEQEIQISLKQVVDYFNVSLPLDFGQ